jgi:hypothetical protein
MGDDRMKHVARYDKVAKQALIFEKNQSVTDRDEEIIRDLFQRYDLVMTDRQSKEEVCDAAYSI